MPVLDSTAVVVHVLFAGLWTGAIVFFAWRLYPLIAAGNIDRNATDRITSGLQWLTRGGAVVFLATGGHMAASGYSANELFGTGRGHLVLSMLVLWVVLTGLVEVTAARLQRHLAESTQPAVDNQLRGLVWAATAVAIALLLVGGVLAI